MHDWLTEEARRATARLAAVNEEIRLLVERQRPRTHAAPTPAAPVGGTRAPVPAARRTVRKSRVVHTIQRDAAGQITGSIEEGTYFDAEED